MSKPGESDDHWRKLASELGLEMGPDPPPEPEPEPPAVFKVPPPAPVEIPDEFRAVEPATVEEFEPPAWPEAEPSADYPEVEAEPEEPLSDVEVVAEGAESEKPRRRRRRSRRKKGEPVTAEAAPATEEPSDDAGDTPLEVMKDWDIPSWNELIASLYRPDR